MRNYIYALVPETHAGSTTSVSAIMDNGGKRELLHATAEISSGRLHTGIFWFTPRHACRIPPGAEVGAMKALPRVRRAERSAEPDGSIATAESSTVPVHILMIDILYTRNGAVYNLLSASCFCTFLTTGLLHGRLPRC